jgi:hypothetical protein
MLKKIISGGQTGADRAALDVALTANFPCGGYCPKGRKAEDGPINNKYPMTEIEGGYDERTEQNVIHSDGTAIFCEAEPTGGTLLTIDLCKRVNKSHLQIEMATGDTFSAAQEVEKFVNENQIQVLNVAGPRASECQSAYSYVERTLGHILGAARRNER